MEEHQLTIQQHGQIEILLKNCFTDYPSGRSFLHQIPAFRWLVYDQYQQLIAHLAVIHRMINIGGTSASIFGISDLCVAPIAERNGLASHLIHKLEEKAIKSNIGFILLFARDHQLYLKNKYQLVNNSCRWLMIHNHCSFGLGARRIEKALMYKQIGNTSWNDGVVDLLGPAF